jgi:hypothetical protein
VRSSEYVLISFILYEVKFLPMHILFNELSKFNRGLISDEFSARYCNVIRRYCPLGSVSSDDFLVGNNSVDRHTDIGETNEGE